MPVCDPSLVQDSWLTYSQCKSALLPHECRHSTPGSYENPVLTATSRTVIFDIFKLGRKLHALDIPRPLAALFTLLRLEDSEAMSNPLFQAMRVWNEVGHISEHESFGKCLSASCSSVDLISLRRAAQSHRRTHSQHSCPARNPCRCRPTCSVNVRRIGFAHTLPFAIEHVIPVLSPRIPITRYPGNVFHYSISLPLPAPHHDPPFLQRTESYNTPS